MPTTTRVVLEPTFDLPGRVPAVWYRDGAAVRLCYDPALDLATLAAFVVEASALDLIPPPRHPSRDRSDGANANSAA